MKMKREASEDPQFICLHKTIDVEPAVDERGEQNDNDDNTENPLSTTTALPYFRE